MKIATQLRAIYEEREPFYVTLKAEIDRQLRALSPPRWHYESRVKGLESFALKVETGRVPAPGTMEDFLGTTFVVPDLASVAVAERLISENFQVHNRRPKSDAKTHKAPSAFPFDDLRLFVSIREDPRYPPSPFQGVVFEVQVKTFLQHAWSVATHDLVYKSNEVSWSKERIAFQVKAMLEHVEMSIFEARKLSDSTAIAKSDDVTKRVTSIIIFLRDVWKADAPEDTRRLAITLDELCQRVGVDVLRTLRKIKANLDGAGLTPPINKSPYTFIFEQLLVLESKKMREYLYQAPRSDRSPKVFIPPDADLPAEIDLLKIKIGIGL